MTVSRGPVRRPVALSDPLAAVARPLAAVVHPLAARSASLWARWRDVRTETLLGWVLGSLRLLGLVVHLAGTGGVSGCGDLVPELAAARLCGRASEEPSHIPDLEAYPPLTGRHLTPLIWPWAWRTKIGELDYLRLVFGSRWCERAEGARLTALGRTARVSGASIQRVAPPSPVCARWVHTEPFHAKHQGQPQVRGTLRPCPPMCTTLWMMITPLERYGCTVPRPLGQGAAGAP